MAHEPGISNIKQSVTTYLDIRGIPQQVLVTIASTARDGGLNGGAAATTLRPGMLVTRITGTGTNAGKFIHYDASEATYNNIANAGVLMDVVEGIDNGDRQAHVCFGGGAIFKRSQLRFFEAADKTEFETNQLGNFPVDTI